MNVIILHSAIIIAYYCIAAYATTDILRFTGEINASVSDSKCYCPSCNHELRITEQIPLISFISNRGRCRYCAAPIPKEEFLMELIIFISGLIINLITGFSFLGLLLCLLFYEICKLTCILLNLKKCHPSVKQLIVSYLFNTIEFSLLFFLYLLKYIVLKN